MKKVLAALFTVLILLGSKELHAQFTVHNNAIDLGGGCFRLTQNQPAQSGSIWNTGLMSTNMGWEMQAELNFGGSNSGGDGMAFVLKTTGSGNIGGGGGLMGFGGGGGVPAISPSVIIEMDTYQGVGQNDPSYDHIGIQKDGSNDHVAGDLIAAPVAAIPGNGNIEDNAYHDLRVLFDANTLEMTVFFDDIERIVALVDIESILGTDSMIWGFTAATGGLSNSHRVRNASWASDFNVTGCTDVGACNYSPEATLDDGSCEYVSCVQCSDYYDFQGSEWGYFPDPESGESFSSASLNTYYADDFHIVVPTDASPIDPLFVLPLDYVILNDIYVTDANGEIMELSDLGLDISCDYLDSGLGTGCYFPPGEQSCFELSGIPSQAGEFTITINLEAYVTVFDVSIAQPLVIENIALFIGSNCADSTACNYNSAAADDDGSCVYPGCVDASACNFDPTAGCDDGSCVTSDATSGCMDSNACNYDEEALCDDDGCVYPPLGLTTCEMGGALCGNGTIWDVLSQVCISINSCPSDLNGNGFVEVSDLLLVLADFGSECEELEPVSGCMDEEASNYSPEAVIEDGSCIYPTSECVGFINYHGYDYAIVQVGEQCWFAENLRTEFYQNGDSIPGDLSNEDWAGAEEGAQAISIYGDALEMFGRVYNGYAVEDERGLCLSGWHVAYDSEWMTLEMELGMSVSDANSGGWRGTDQGIQMKTVSGWSEGENGTNSSGFGAKPAGNRTSQGHWTNAVHNAFFWTPSSDTNSASLFRQLRFEEAGVFRGNYGALQGLSIRCVRDE